jgi:hypothetical protein
MRIKVLKAKAAGMIKSTFGRNERLDRIVRREAREMMREF